MPINLLCQTEVTKNRRASHVLKRNCRSPSQLKKCQSTHLLPSRITAHTHRLTKSQVSILFNSIFPQYPPRRVAKMLQQPSQTAKRQTKSLLFTGQAFLIHPLCQHQRVAVSQLLNREDWATRQVAYRTKIGWSCKPSRCILIQTKRAKTFFLYSN